MRERELLLEIERSREEMNRLSKSLPLISGEVLAKSRKLDDLLNQYQKSIPY
ncbi:MAG TPA: aspartyl-phosphate phosphatase Spo0E family protein [Bacillales bacterium]